MGEIQVYSIFICYKRETHIQVYIYIYTCIYVEFLLFKNEPYKHILLLNY